jgi:hypothetical protein
LYYSRLGLDYQIRRKGMGVGHHQIVSVFGNELHVFTHSYQRHSPWRHFTGRTLRVSSLAFLIKKSIYYVAFSERHSPMDWTRGTMPFGFLEEYKPIDKPSVAAFAKNLGLTRLKIISNHRENYMEHWDIFISAARMLKSSSTKFTPSFQLLAT